MDALIDKPATGRQSLHQIDKAVQDARKTLEKHTEILEHAVEAILDNRLAQLNSFKTIAEIRMDLVERAEDDGDLGKIDRTVARLIEEHNDIVADLKALVKVGRDHVEHVERQRRIQEQKRDKADEAYDAVHEKCLRTLRKKPEFEEKFQKSTELRAMHNRAVAKYKLAEAGVDEKLEPYLDDPYFSYLYFRDYGESYAEGWFLTRMLDDWLARRIKYKQAYANFRRLQDIPDRLSDYAEGIETQLLELEEELTRQENRLMTEMGAERLLSKIVEEQTILSRIDDDLEQAEQIYRRDQEALVNAGQGNTSPFLQAMDMLVAALKQVELPFLNRLALQSISTEDDEAVGNLLALWLEEESLDLDKQEAENMAGILRAKLDELEALRRNFKIEKMDLKKVVFPTLKVVGSVIGFLAIGALTVVGGIAYLALKIATSSDEPKSRNSWWDHDHDYDHDDKQINFTWDSSPSSSPSGPSSFTPSSSGGSGFGTGGGFGGDGFKTGGGF